MNFRQKAGAALVALMTLVAVGLASPASASSTQSGPFRYKLYGYDRCMDVRGVDYNNGAQLQTYSCIYGQPNQRFYVPTNVGRQVEIVAMHSGKCLDVAGVALYAWAPIQQYDCFGWGQTNQVFVRTNVYGNLYMFMAIHSRLCLAASGWYNGADLIQDACVNNGRNYWEEIPA